jgi:hypothetical protein
VQVKFAKYILGVNKTASNLAVLCELGMIPSSEDAIKLSFPFLPNHPKIIYLSRI